MSNYGMPLLNGLASNVRQVPSRELTLTALYERYLINESTAKGKTTPCNEETNTLNDFETSSKDGSDQDSLCREMQSSSSLSDNLTVNDSEMHHGSILRTRTQICLNETSPKSVDGPWNASFTSQSSDISSFNVGHRRWNPYLVGSCDEKDHNSRRIIRKTDSYDTGDSMTVGEDDTTLMDDSTIFKSNDDEDGSDSLEYVGSLSQSPTYCMSFLYYPKELQDAVNVGNMCRVKHLVDHFFNKNCTIKIRSPAFNYDVNGYDYVTHFYETYLKAHPDLVISLKDVKTSRGRDCWFAECSYRYTATRVYQNIINRFHGLEQMPITKLMDKRKFSDAEWKYYQNLEEHAIKSNKSIIVFIKAKTVLVVDDRTNKISGMLVRSYLSSFRVEE